MKLLKVENNIIGLFEQNSDIQTQLNMYPNRSYSVTELEDKTDGFLGFMAYREWWLFDGLRLKTCASWFLEFLKPKTWEDVHVFYLKQNDKMYVFTKKYFAEVTKLF